MSGRCRGFTLVEVLTALIVGAILGAALLEAWRWLSHSSERVSRTLLARDRGERVLSFLEPRVLHAGLGLSSCRADGVLRRAFGYGSPGAPMIASWPDHVRPLQIYKEFSGSWPDPAVNEGGVYRGGSLCLLYAVPSGVILKNEGGGSVTLEPGERLRGTVVSGSLSGAVSVAGLFHDLRSWFSLPLTGYPLFWEGGTPSKPVLKLADGVVGPVVAPPVNELYLLRGERFFVMNGTLYFQELRGSWYPPLFQPRENGVLALWCEWRPALRTLDLWVLASGGPAVFAPSARPSSWPVEAPWKKAFEEHEVFVSRGSWRAENL